MITLTYVGPDGATSDRYGELRRGHAYQEQDDKFAAYLAVTHPDHWQADGCELDELRAIQSPSAPVADTKE